MARERPPSKERIARVRDKLAAADACVVVARAPLVIAMALAEPRRGRDGTGPIDVGFAHISMVFVHPRAWGQGVGGCLLDGLHRSMSGKGWHRASVWTGVSNTRARGLYESRAYRVSGEHRDGPHGEQIMRYTSPPLP